MAFAAGAIIGEGLTWVPDEAAIYWVDIKARTLNRLIPASGATRNWVMPADIGGFALHAGGSPDAIVALRTGIFGLDLASGALVSLASPPFDPNLFRFNDIGIDPAGRCWIGSMFDPVAPWTGRRRTAPLHSFTLADGLREEPHHAYIHNGLAWSPSGDRLYVADSARRIISTYPFHPASGIVGDRRDFVVLPKAGGVPDGAAIDRDGFYWCAIFGGARLQRYAPDGKLDREVMLPVSQPTMCCFAGDDLRDMYVASAQQGLDTSLEPLAGHILRFRPGVAGQKKPYQLGG